MYSNRENRKTLRYAVCTALAASLIAGCAGGNPLAKANSKAAVAATSANYPSEKVITKAEKAVAKAPRDASLRVELANAYLGAGRFEAAVVTFEDAISLGVNSPRTALSLALAYAGSGHNAKALTVLDQWRDSIPASDYGLAIALAGETSRGVAVLSDELRGGTVDAKLRQNLAYAYALDGRWREARLMAAQDLPADQLDARISEWAMQGRAQDYRKRVAGLLGAPVRSDSGQPEHLALSNISAEAQPMMAMAASEPPVAAVSEAPALAANTDRELPLVESSESFSGAGTSEPSSPVLPVEKQAAAPLSPKPAVRVNPQPVREASAVVARNEPVSAPVGQEFDDAFAAPDSSQRYVSRPVVQPVPSRDEPVPVASRATSQRGSSHLVQLGSFSSLKNAQRARKIYQRRHPDLAEQDLRITKAVVRGKKYWRVAAVGYDRRSARKMCSNVKIRGFGCIAYAASRPLPGALPQPSGSGPMRARR